MSGWEPLRSRRIALAVGGGIAAYKAAELARLFVKAGAEVDVIMTAAARRFIGELTFQALTGRPVLTDLFDLSQESEIGHIQIADRADLLVVAPATANLLARLAAGMADDAVAAVALACKAPLLLAPAMNVNMWSHPLTQANVRRLVDVVGAQVVGPGDGFLACRWTGPGRLAEPADIVEAARYVLSPRDLGGRSIVIGAGPTHEAIDPVRFVGNRSSGKMGYALARAARLRGASVTLVSGPVALAAPLGVARVSVGDARAMEAAVRAAAERADAVVMAAAVADFRPAAALPSKLKRGGRAGLALELVANPDILAGLGARRRGGRPLLVGFAAETEATLANARGKLAAKRCDLVVANDVAEPGAGFDVDDNHVWLLEAGEDGATEIGPASKDEVAHRVLDRVAARLAALRGDGGGASAPPAARPPTRRRRR